MGMDYWSYEGVGVNVSDIPLNRFDLDKVKAKLNKYLEKDKLEMLNKRLAPLYRCEYKIALIESFLMGETDYTMASLVGWGENKFLLNGADPNSTDDYLFIGKELPWEISEDMPKSMEEAVSIIAEAVMSVTDLTEEEASALVDRDLYVPCSAS